jgi:hypothetical protein
VQPVAGEGHHRHHKLRPDLDGHIADLDDYTTTTSELVQSAPVRVTRGQGLQHHDVHALDHLASAAWLRAPCALPIAGDDDTAKMKFRRPMPARQPRQVGTRPTPLSAQFSPGSIHRQDGLPATTSLLQRRDRIHRLSRRVDVRPTLRELRWPPRRPHAPHSSRLVPADVPRFPRARSLCALHAPCPRSRLPVGP